MIYGMRTTCRPIEASDQTFLHELNNDPAVRAHVVGWGFPSSLEEQTRWFEGPSTPTTQRWLIEDLDGRPIGLTGLWDVDWHNRNALSAIKLGGAHAQRGQGFGTDVIKAIMAFAFYDVGLERLYSTVLESNEASIKAYTQKCGWRVEGTLRNHVWRQGQFVNLLHIGALRADFDALPDAQAYRDLACGGAPRNPA